jgi:ribose transport system substrate-binding protein
MTYARRTRARVTVIDASQRAGRSRPAPRTKEDHVMDGRRRGRLPAAVGLAALTIIGTAGVAGAQSPGAPAAASCDTGGKQIAFVVPLRIPIVDQILVGARDAAAACNVELTDVGPQAFDPPAAVQAFQDAVAAGADGLVFDALPNDVYAQPVSQTIIPMAQYIASVTTPDAPVLVGINQYDVGYSIADLIIGALPADASGSVVAGNCTPGLRELDQRIQGIKDRFAQKLPSVTVDGPLETSQDPTTNQTAWQSIIQANPQALAFMGVCDQDLPSLTRIKQQDPAATYLLAGAEVQPVTLDGIVAGIVVGAVGQNPYLEGYIPTRLVALELAGVEVPQTGWISPGLDVVTAENAEAAIAREASPEAATAFYAPIVEEFFASDMAARTRPISDLDAPTIP